MRNWRKAVTGVFAAVLLVSCSGKPSVEPSSSSSEVVGSSSGGVQPSATHTYGLTISESTRLQVECLRDRGWSVDYNPETEPDHFGVSAPDEQGDAFEKDLDECRALYPAVEVETSFEDMPEGLQQHIYDREVFYVDCLHEYEDFDYVPAIPDFEKWRELILSGNPWSADLYFPQDQSRDEYSLAKLCWGNALKAYP